MKFNIGQFEFGTKAAAKALCREVLAKWSVGESISGADHDFLLGLVQLCKGRAQLLGTKIDHFTVQVIKPWGTRGFRLHRDDGTSATFSYRECLRPSTAAAKFTAAARNEVAGQIAAYKRKLLASGKARCGVSREPLSPKDCQIDHAPSLRFEYLLADWLAQEHLTKEQVPLVTRSDGTTVNRFSDRAQALSWRKFHASHSLVRALAGGAHREVCKLEPQEADEFGLYDPLALYVSPHRRSDATI